MLILGLINCVLSCRLRFGLKPAKKLHNQGYLVAYLFFFGPIFDSKILWEAPAGVVLGSSLEFERPV